MNLTAQRCYNHEQREAVARCPECGRFHCRECVTEFRDRLLCTVCVAALSSRHERTDGRGFERLRRGVAIAAGFLLAWACFLVLGQLLFSVPSRFHDGRTLYGETD